MPILLLHAAEYYWVYDIMLKCFKNEAERDGCFSCCTIFTSAVLFKCYYAYCSVVRPLLESSSTKPSISKYMNMEYDNTLVLLIQDGS